MTEEWTKLKIMVLVALLLILIFMIVLLVLEMKLNIDTNRRQKVKKHYKGGKMTEKEIIESKIEYLNWLYRKNWDDIQKKEFVKILMNRYPSSKYVERAVKMIIDFDGDIPEVPISTFKSHISFEEKEVKE